MSFAASLRVLGWLVRDTLRQALPSAASWLLLAGSAAGVVACLVAPLDGPAAVYALQAQLAGWAAHVAALPLALILTAGMLPGFLAPHTATLLLAKPTPRWLLLAGKVLGVVAFVAAHAVVFVGGAWLALAARGRVWDPTFLLCAPLLVLHFAVFFSFSAVLASATRNAAACAFGTLAFWLLCWAMNFGRQAALGALGAPSPALGWVTEAAYWVLPKPLDFQLALSGGARPGLSLLASALAGVALLAVAAYDFGTAEY
jgi:ABC-type transport system involved in multi-copper enzyme maturation permease subunit